MEFVEHAMTEGPASHLEQALARYEAALTALQAITSLPDSEPVLEVLVARDAVQEALAAQVQPPTETEFGGQESALLLPVARQSFRALEPTQRSKQVMRLAQLDSCLQQQAERIAQAVDLAGLRASLNPPERSWWWFFEPPPAPSWWNRCDWLWTGISIVSLTFSLSLIGDIAPRFLAGGPDLLGTGIVSVQSILTLVASGSIFTQEGRKQAEKLFSSLVDRRFWQEARAASSLLLFLLLGGLWLSLPEIAVWYDQIGIKHFQKGQWSSARSNYERALKLNPDYAKAHFNLGVLYEELQDFAKARTQYQLALQSGGDKEGSAGAYNNLARLYVRDGNYGAAVSLLRGLQLRLRGKGDVQLLYSLNKNLGWARLQQDRLAEAEAWLQTAIELGETHKAQIPNFRSAAAHCLLAQVLDKKQMLDKKGDTKQRALAEWQNCLDSYGLLPEEDEWIGIAQKKLTPSKIAPAEPR
jgi:tetratricopeptide (TPR) repeat protein